ncbi:MAG TPA: hypothetical protein VLL95_04035, partial [Phnomibacter sp.]|nr:hypothetical protein [Phnomibacter sp.]
VIIFPGLPFYGRTFTVKAPSAIKKSESNTPPSPAGGTETTFHNSKRSNAQGKGKIPYKTYT